MINVCALGIPIFDAAAPGASPAAALFSPYPWARLSLEMPIDRLLFLLFLYEEHYKALSAPRNSA